MPVGELPIASVKEPLIQVLNQHQVTIVMGETGSGKSTLIPMWMAQLEHKGHVKVGICQPRRVACTSLAGHVAKQCKTALGDRVGYTIRFTNKTSAATRIKYMTDGILLRELLTDPLLSAYQVLILDEIHERSLRTDILMGLLKQVIKKRRDLKLILMSATLDADKFVHYFQRAKVVYVQGRLHPVRQVYLKSDPTDYLDAALVAAIQIHLEHPPGDILVFLTGQEEIESAEKTLLDYNPHLPPSCPKVFIAPLFASLPAHLQQRVFEPCPKGHRKIILSTNIAETSLTLPGVKYVIDPGYAKVRTFNPRTGMETLAVQRISRSSARQRAGRAGREGPGECFRLYSESTFYSMPEDTEPELMRCNLASAVLMLKACGVEQVERFDFVDKPSTLSVVKAMDELKSLKAMDDKGRLTDFGRRMTKFPLDPRFAAVLLAAHDMECTGPVLTIIAMLSVDTLFITSTQSRAAYNDARKQYTHVDSDLLTLLNLYDAYTKASAPSTFCSQVGLHARSMSQATSIRSQLAELCDIDDGDAEYDTIMTCFLRGFSSNVLVRAKDGSYSMHGKRVSVHPSSVVFGRSAPALLFIELVVTSKQYMRMVSVLPPTLLPSHS